VEAGNTVLVVEHNLDVVKRADWVIDLGPEGGSGGGRIVAEGTPEQVARAKASHTGRALGPVLAAARGAAAAPRRRTAVRRKAVDPAAATAAPRGPGNGKAVFSIRLAPALLDKARNACFFTPGLTLAALTEAALTRELARMEAERGGPFENRTADIPRGRRIV